ncbi:hypothetical protein [Streptomyces sp. PH10-H1]|uniref:hypothetical protein n=1 Tax=Streptomyces sp. PH10-H1 TaxID=3046212 RepID=UPI0024B8A16B|nr:hypothetical protein [Streptomyces sp. PH10-H1]MDJ0346270.1 hypothetical protein [Streptomyces sp. PH10-H1]
MVTANVTEDPESAYALAPSITLEITWVARTARDFGQLTSLREYWLRKAAVFDRIALTEHHRSFIVAGSGMDADTAAEEAARRLVEHDRADAISAPREYVRREYARWSTAQ